MTRTNLLCPVNIFNSLIQIEIFTPRSSSSPAPSLYTFLFSSLLLPSPQHLNFPLGLLELTFQSLVQLLSSIFLPECFLHFIASGEAWPSPEGIASHATSLSGSSFFFRNFFYSQKWTFETDCCGRSLFLSAPNLLSKL